MNPVDPLILQRLIDGECSADEIRSTLALAEQHPDLWPAIAMALVEDRAWQRQFQRETPKPGLALGSDRVAASGPGNGASTLGIVVDGSPRNSTLSARLNSNLNHSIAIRSTVPSTLVRLNRLALAACALLAAMLGYVAGQNFPSANPPGELLADADTAKPASKSLDNQVAAAPVATPKITPASLQADYHLQLPNDERSNLSGDIPLYNVQSMEQWKQLSQPTDDQFQLSQEMLADLKARGMRVRQDVRFLSGNLQDGRKFIIPIRSINFSPGQ